MLGRRALRAVWPFAAKAGVACPAGVKSGSAGPADVEAGVACPAGAKSGFAGPADVEAGATCPADTEAATSWSLEAAAAKAYEPVLGTLLADMRGQIVSLCQHLGARRVVDVCCGPAGLSRRMAEAGLEVCGVDLSWPMLRQARSHCGAAPKLGQPPLLVRADATVLPFARVTACPSVATSLPFVSATACPNVDTACPNADTPVSPTSPKASFDIAVLTLALHTMPAAVGQAAVAEMLRVASYAIVADYRLAERNCDLPAVALGRAVEWLVGGEHYACYTAFMAAGGLEGFARSHGYAPIERRRILGGAGTIMVLKAAI